MQVTVHVLFHVKHEGGLEMLEYFYHRIINARDSIEYAEIDHSITEKWLTDVITTDQMCSLSMLTKIYRKLSNVSSADDVNKVEQDINEAWYNGQISDYLHYYLLNGMVNLKKKFKEEERCE